ncbi:MAG: DUF4831 family protein [Bacteroidales bacterium]
MKNISVFVLLVTMVLITACGSQVPLQRGHVRTMKSGDTGKGMYYALPRSVVAIDVEVTQTVKKPGPYAAYAERYLGLNEVIFSPTVSYEISSVSINGYSEPDPEQIYYMAFPEEEEQSLYVSLTEEGLIAGVNREFDNMDFQSDVNESTDYGYFGSDATFNYFIDTNLKEQVDTVIEHVRMDTITVQRQTLRRSWVEKGEELRASEVAEYILEIREKKFDLISGFQEINYSKEALEYMYSEMDKLESDYLDLFTGITASQTINYRFIHTPEKDQADTRHTLFRFSHEEGVIPANEDTGGVPVTIVYQRSNATNELDGQIRGTSEEGKEDVDGLHYRIPEYTTLLIYTGNEKRAEARMQVNQFGIVTSLPPGQSTIEFYPNTGSVKSAGELHDNEDDNE